VVGVVSEISDVLEFEMSEKVERLVNEHSHHFFKGRLLVEILSRGATDEPSVRSEVYEGR